MPNWVRNKLFIHGPSDMVKQCTLDIGTDSEHISFEKIMPRPKDIGDGWYDWSVEHWSTKWDVSESYEDEMGRICFDTAWSTPIGIMIELSKRYKELNFEVEYADEDLGFNAGCYNVYRGKMEMIQSYGVEESCNVWGYDFEEMFPDIKRDRNIDRILDE